MIAVSKVWEDTPQATNVYHAGQAIRQCRFVFFFFLRAWFRLVLLKLAARKQSQMTPEEIRQHMEIERLYR